MATSTMTMKRRGKLALLGAGCVLAVPGCGSDGGTDPVPKLEALPVAASTVQAAVDFMMASPVTLPTTCSGGIQVNCPGGVPAATSISLPVTHTTPTVVQVSPGVYTFNTDFTINSAVAIPISYAGVSCNVLVNTTQGTNATVHVTGTGTFATNPTTGVNFLTMHPTVTGIEAADLAMGSGSDFLCATVPIPSSVITDMVNTTLTDVAARLCGAPGPALFVRCPDPGQIYPLAEQ